MNADATPLPERPPERPMEWRWSRTPLAYGPAAAAMERRAAAVAEGRAPGLLWLLEHRPCVTAGTSTTPEEVRAAALALGSAPLATGRGGRLTWHGPGQRVVYCVRPLDGAERDVRRFVATIEGWIIAALARLGVEAFRSPLGAGVFVFWRGGEAKIASLGVRVRRWTSFHGFSINVDCAMMGFEAIVPCGLAGVPTVRLVDLDQRLSMPALDRALAASCPWPFTARNSTATRAPAVPGRPIEGARP